MADSGVQERTGFLSKVLRRLAVSTGRPLHDAQLDSCGASRENRGLAVSPDVGASVHEDGLALLHIPTGRVFVCNRTGSRIWQGVVRGLSAAAISEEISRECGVTHDLVERHTSSFLTELVRRGLLTRRLEGAGK